MLTNPRLLSALAGLALLTGCGAKQYLPSGPVLDAEGREELLSARPAAAVVYSSPPKVAYPVLPLQVWGVTYDLDVVLVSKHPDYDMHEYARLNTPDGELWIAKDALEATKEQSIVADVDDIHSWMPELPIERKQAKVHVRDASEADDWLDLTIKYKNLADQQVVVRYEGPPPEGAETKRNGNTMGHSAGVAMAVLDIPEKSFAKYASISIDGAEQKIAKVAGLVKLQLVLKQSQGGLSTGDFWLEAAPEDDVAFTAFYKNREGGRVRADWTFERAARKYRLKQETDFRTLQYTYRIDQGAVELLAMDVMQFGYDEPVAHIEIRPALPDMRREFPGTHTSRFVVDVNGQQGHAVGRVEAFWEDGQAKVHMIPEAPYWTADRPMMTTITYAEGRATTKIERVAVEE